MSREIKHIPGFAKTASFRCAFCRKRRTFYGAERLLGVPHRGRARGLGPLTRLTQPRWRCGCVSSLPPSRTPSPRLRIPAPRKPAPGSRRSADDFIRRTQAGLPDSRQRRHRKRTAAYRGHGVPSRNARLFHAAAEHAEKAPLRPFAYRSGVVVRWFTSFHRAVPDSLSTSSTAS
jgi:hypothetical protein